MSVKEVMLKHPEAKIASEVLLEQLESKIDQLEKVIVNLIDRVDYLEGRINSIIC